MNFIYCVYKNKSRFYGGGDWMHRRNKIMIIVSDSIDFLFKVSCSRMVHGTFSMCECECEIARKQKCYCFNLRIASHISHYCISVYCLCKWRSHFCGDSFTFLFAFSHSIWNSLLYNINVSIFNNVLLKCNTSTCPLHPIISMFLSLSLLFQIVHSSCTSARRIILGERKKWRNSHCIASDSIDIRI